ncbi:avidin family protein [Lentinula edodes]|uniref:Avidin family protein n=1 Tax=Lentinula edodes TaxID=5353 RepID=A0A1Q3E0H9_LENED|nr:avidin family protein [Lentinula edodes]
MILIADQNGGLSGQYNSAVGNATNFYNLTGRFDTLPPTDAGISVGWVVDWKNDLLNAHAVTTWSGQYFDNDNVETILTQWLLTTSSNCVDLFNNTLIEITNYCHSSANGFSLKQWLNSSLLFFFSASPPASPASPVLLALQHRHYHRVKSEVNFLETGSTNLARR